MAKEKIIGIDLGTSNSQAAVMIAGKPTIIPSAEGATIAGKMFPSVVAFTKDGQLLVGEPARRQAVSNPEGTVMKAKRKMGTNYKYKIYGKEYTPQQISAFILQKIKRDAESFLGEKIKKAVITVPAYFNDNQRQATKDAGEIAGLEVVRIINEPTAASLAYGIDKSEEEHTILVFDFGGGTLDVTILEFGGGVFEVKSTSGDTNLGGTDMDEALMNYIIDEFKKDSGIDLRKDNAAMQRLREAAEKAKIELSSVLETEINLPYITADASGPKHLAMKITRAKLEELVTSVIERCSKPIDTAIKEAKISKDDITKVILVGGPTRMPIVQKFVEEHIGKKIERGVDPMECVAIGAAIQGAVLAGEIKDIVLLDAATDFQTAVTIHVVQGERPMAADNTSLGKFNLVGIPPAPRGVPQIEVTFDIDANGILNVSAKDLGTGKEQKITITASTKLSKEEIERMKKEAEEHAEEDRKRREEVEIKNNADSLAYQTEKFISDYGDKIPADIKSKVESALKELKDSISKGDIQDIKAKMESLSKVTQEAGAAIYQQQQATQQTAESTEEKKGEKNGKEKVVDAEYRVEKDKEEKK